MRIFKMHRTVENGATIALMFEGDKLDEDDEVQSSEVGDMDILEVHMR